jgi:hypothetical protein
MPAWDHGGGIDVVAAANSVAWLRAHLEVP